METTRVLNFKNYLGVFNFVPLYFFVFGLVPVI